MKNTRKILVALFLIITVLMSLATVSAFAADGASEQTRTIYFSNNKGWSKVNAYYWGGSSTVAWPGTAMTYVTANDYGEDIYSITVPADSTHIIFNNGSEQTVDIKLNAAVNAYYLDAKSGSKWTVGTYNYSVDGCNHTPAGEAISSVAATCTEDGEDVFTCANCSETYTVVTTAKGHKYENGKCSVCNGVPTYTVAGVAELCGTAWDTGNTANDMTYDEATGTYSKVYDNLPAGTYTFKCVQDHAWDVNYGGVGESADKDGNYVVTLTGETNTLTIILTGNTISVKVGEYLEPDTPVDPEDPENPDTPVDPEDPETPDTPVDPETPAVDYYLIGWINGADYGCEADYENLGEYKFADGKLVATFNQDSYVFIKTGDNAHWFLFETYCEATSGTLYEGKTEKMKVPGNVELTFTLVVNEDGTLTLSYETASTDTPVDPENPENPETPENPDNPDTPVDPENPDTPVDPENPENPDTPDDPDTPAVDYYLAGWINGADYGIESDKDTIGDYKFVDGKLVLTFNADSYVLVKTGDNANWYMTNGWLGMEVTEAVLGTGYGDNGDKLFVPGNVEITFTLTANEDGTLTLSYTTGESTTPDTPIAPNPGSSDYYLVGYINGADYGFGEVDWENLGDYEFVNGKLVVTFAEDSYVIVKTGDNAKWYMTDGWLGMEVTEAVLGADRGETGDKLYVPGGVEITFTLTDNGDGTLTLSYTTGSVTPEQPGDDKPADPEQPGDDKPADPEQPGDDKPADPEQPGDDKPADPEQPEDPTDPDDGDEVELNFFQKIWKAITDFFAKIGDFFKNLFAKKQ